MGEAVQDGDIENTCKEETRMSCEQGDEYSAEILMNRWRPIWAVRHA